MSEPRRRPDLVAVEGGAGDAPEGAARRRARRALPWLLALVALVFGVLWFSQLQRAQRLTEEVAALEGELSRSRATVAAFQARMDDVRGFVGDLSDRLGALRELVSEDPVAPDTP